MCSRICKEYARGTHTQRMRRACLQFEYFSFDDNQIVLMMARGNTATRDNSHVTQGMRRAGKSMSMSMHDACGEDSNDSNGLLERDAAAAAAAWLGRYQPASQQ